MGSGNTAGSSSSQHENLGYAIESLFFKSDYKVKLGNDPDRRLEQEVVLILLTTSAFDVGNTMLRGVELWVII